MTANEIADARLRRTFGISLEEYDMMLVRQNGGCLICGKPPKPDKRLHVDHDHKVSRYKVETGRTAASLNIKPGWYAKMPKTGIIVCQNKRNDAIRAVRKLAKRFSVRGLLCWPCNRALRVFFDDPVRLEAAAQYLRKYKEKGNQLG